MNNIDDKISNEMAFRRFVVQQLNFLTGLIAKILTYVAEDNFEKELYNYVSQYYNYLVTKDEEGADRMQKEMLKNIMDATIRNGNK